MLIATWAAAAALQGAPARAADAASSPPAAGPRACDACPETVSIPGGDFMMGTPAGDTERDDDELPQRRVQVRPFALGRTEVTVAQWRAFAVASGYLTEAERNVNVPGCFTWEPDNAAWEWRAGRSWREPGWRQKDDEPVVCVDWVDAQAYLRWLAQASGVKGWRLPSEAEWEYAARAGSTTRRPWGDEPDVHCAHGNGADRTKGPRGRTWSETLACRDGYWYTAPVASYRPNAWGLHDMLGNVWEWVQDCYGPYAGAPSDGRAQEAGDCKGRVVRGGAWDDPPGVLRPAERFWLGSGNRNNNIGFRVARTLAP